MTHPVTVHSADATASDFHEAKIRFADEQERKARSEQTQSSPRVGGRVPIVRGSPNFWYIGDQDDIGPSGAKNEYLNHKGNWKKAYGLHDEAGFFWPTREAAIDFIHACASREPTPAKRVFVSCKSDAANAALDKAEELFCEPPDEPKSGEPGWYECRLYGALSSSQVLWWSGRCLYRDKREQDGNRCTLADYIDFIGPLASPPSEVAALRHAAAKENNEICQLLGKALGYVAADGEVEVGEHTAVTLAMEAAEKITEFLAKQGAAEKSNRDLRTALIGAIVDYDRIPYQLADDNIERLKTVTVGAGWFDGRTSGYVLDVQAVDDLAGQGDGWSWYERAVSLRKEVAKLESDLKAAQSVAESNYEKWQEWRKKCGEEENARQQIWQHLKAAREESRMLRARG